MKNLKARRMHQKAQVLWRDGHTERAETLALHALDLLPPAEGANMIRIADRVSVLETLAQFASDLANHSEAERRCDEALDLLKQVESDASADAWRVAILVHKGNSQRLSAKYDESALTLARALVLSERIPDATMQAGPLNALGILAKDRGLYEEAGIYYDKALRLLVDRGGTNAPELAGIYHNLAGLAHIQGQFDRAEEPARQAIRLRKATSRPDPEGLAADLSVLGAVLAGQERFDEAADILSEALALWQARYGKSHYEVAVQLHNLAAIQQAQGEYSSAEASLTEALAIKRGVLGGNHPEIAAILNNLATVYSDTGRRREASECYDHAIEIFTQTLGEDHASTVACIQNRHNMS
ncbi:tetratricopeptide repeat protein [Pseudarthrobacter sulfonivorans]|uniref:tetratricopeptide repeat protein n=1 Tax=Pseudarthrobacter sulfonivorans TaxID=121292 RepID=UPI0013DA8A6B|nr:tetratricopeptide repeat protein [Pseudarthrobacter sulfonivorans]MDP9999635.1 tetratricopeptide (TPR) repeat protein [Pseudarthrobacter sulfonivorans]